MAENKRYYWLKLMDDFFTSKRIKKLRKLAGGDTYTIIYLKMQLLSLRRGGYLEYTGLEDEFYKEVALDIDEDADNVSVTINYLLSCGLLVTTDNIEYLMPFVKNNLGSETASTLRSRKSRENKQNSVALQHQCNNLQQNCNVDIDIDIDTREEKETMLVSNETNCQTQSVRRVVDAWNALQDVGIKPISRVSSGSKRYQSLIARLREYGEDDVLQAIERIRLSDFLQGKHGGRPWLITFDWFVLPNNFPKVLEGNYDSDGSQQVKTGDARLDRLYNRVSEVDNW